jgi:hypothetical protein
LAPVYVHIIAAIRYELLLFITVITAPFRLLGLDTVESYTHVHLKSVSNAENLFQFQTNFGELGKKKSVGVLLTLYFSQYFRLNSVFFMRTIEKQYDIAMNFVNGSK